MKIRSAVAAALLVLVVLADVAQAAEIKVMCALALREVMEDLAPKFERSSAHKLAITFGTLGVVVKRVQGGETADVALIPRQGIASLAKDGKIRADKVVIVAHSGIAVAVRKGAPKPDISSPEAFKRTLLAAKSITYSNPALGGASGIHFAKVLDRLGIADEVKAKSIFLPTDGPVGVLVADGQAEIAVQQTQLLIQVPGIDIVGPLPGDLQETVVFSAAVMAAAKNVDAAMALIDFLRTPEAAAVFRAKGLEP